MLRWFLWLPLTPAGAATTSSPSTTSCRTARSARCAEGRTTVVFGTGDPDADLMFVGEAPGLPRGQAGQAVRRPGRQAARQAAGARSAWRASTCFIANVLKCRPPGNRDPAAARDRGLRGPPVPPDRADPSRGWSARSATSPRSCCPAGPRASPRCAGSRRCASWAGAPSSCIRSSIRPPRSTRPRCWSSCAPTSARCPPAAGAAAGARTGPPARGGARAGGAGRPERQAAVAAAERARSSRPSAASGLLRSLSRTQLAPGLDSRSRLRRVASDGSTSRSPAATERAAAAVGRAAAARRRGADRRATSGRARRRSCAGPAARWASPTRHQPLVHDRPAVCGPGAGRPRRPLPARCSSGEDPRC